MLSGNTSVAVGTRTLLLLDRLDLLVEILAITIALDTLEQRHGGDVLIEDLRRRLQAAHILVQTQLHTLIYATDTPTVH